MLEKYFKLSEHNTNVKTEVIAGITTFMTMGYIIMVNPGILSATGMDFGALITATCLSTAIAPLRWRYANYPFAGMGLNTFSPLPWCLGGITGNFIIHRGVAFLLLTLVTAREASLMHSNEPETGNKCRNRTVYFIGFTGRYSGGKQATYVALGDFHDPKVLLSVFGLIVAGLCWQKG